MFFFISLPIVCDVPAFVSDLLVLRLGEMLAFVFKLIMPVFLSSSAEVKKGGSSLYYLRLGVNRSDSLAADPDLSKLL